MRSLVFAALLAVALPVTAQTVPARGTDATFDVAAWNVEWFGSTSNGPGNESVQQANVLQTIREAEIDVWILEEIASRAAFSTLLRNLGSEWEGTTVSAGSSQEIAVVYRTSVLPDASVDIALTNLDSPFSNSDGNLFGGRPPLRLQGTVTLPGRAPMPVMVLGVHLKAQDDADSYNKRQASAAALKDYIDGLLADGDPSNDRVLVAGDFNDLLDGSITSGRDTPFQVFLDDPDYRFLTQPLADAETSTYCWFDDACGSVGSTIDHLLTTAPLAALEVPGATDRFGELLSLFGNPTDASTNNGYDDTTSDHLPVLTRFDLSLQTAAEDGADREGPAMTVGPNPFGSRTTVALRLAAPADVRVEAFDALGRRVALLASGPLGAGEHAVAFDGQALAPGVYVVRAVVGDRTESRVVVRR